MAPRFQLLGKKSDLISLRQGSLHYFDLNRCLAERLSYHGELQIHHDGKGDVTVLVRPDFPAEPARAAEILAREFGERQPGLAQELADWTWRALPTSDGDWVWSETGGKLIHVCLTAGVR